MFTKEVNDKLVAENQYDWESANDNILTSAEKLGEEFGNANPSCKPGV